MERITFLAIILLLATQIFGHSYVSSPATRTNQGQSQSGCRVSPPTTCVVCDGKASQASSNPTTIQRGQSVSIRWARNNHPGGFVRFAWAPTAQSDDAAAFDGGVQLYVCFEIPATSCLPEPGQGEPYANDKPGIAQTDCGTTIQVPTWLTDGKWTLQWAWFGGFGILGDYYSCIDYQVSGGPSDARGAPLFYGGDRANPSVPDKCLFRNADELGICVQEPCNAPTYPLGVAQLGAPKDKNGQAIQVGAQSGSGALSGTGVSLSGEDSGTPPQPCTANSDCSSGICEITGFCAKASSSGFGASGIAAVVFAMIFLVVILVVGVFFFINRKEVPYMVPFKGRI